MSWRFTTILLLLALSGPRRLVADSILDELHLIDSSGDEVTLGLIFDAAGNSIYTFVDPTSNPQGYTPPGINLTTGLLQLILSIDGNSANLAPLFAPGAVFASLTPDFTPVQMSVTDLLTDSPPQLTTGEPTQDSFDTPEPATLSFPGGFMLIFAGCVFRIARLRNSRVAVRRKPFGT